MCHFLVCKGSGVFSGDAAIAIVMSRVAYLSISVNLMSCPMFQCSSLYLLVKTIDKIKLSASHPQADKPSCLLFLSSFSVISNKLPADSKVILGLMFSQPSID